MAGKLNIKSTVDGTNMKMPVVGLGTWQSTEQEMEEALNAAINAGYRHIDTAFVYLNECSIGNTLEKIFSSGKIKREDLFIVTKLPSIANRPEYVETYLKRSLNNLKLDYVDLYLVHNPVGLMHSEDLFPKGPDGELLLDYECDLEALWKAMELQVDAGRAKAIGVSNFNWKQVKRIVDSCRIKPANNQVEMHIYLQQKELVKYCNENNVTICAYGPIGSPGLLQFTVKNGFSSEGMKDLRPLSDPVVVDIAKKHNKSPSHVLLRFLVQNGVAVIPKSSNPARIKQNIDIFDFELDEKDCEQLADLDKGSEGRLFCGGLFSAMVKHPEYPF